jgi:SAM-dependent methyltransferase
VLAVNEYCQNHRRSSNVTVGLRAGSSGGPHAFRAGRAGRRLPDVDVYHGDATALPFGEATFDVVVCFTMLHHVSTPELQDRLFRESRRVLRAGGVLAGSDSRWGLLFALAHLGDTLKLVDPVGLPERLRAAGFVDATTDLRRSAFRFRAAAPTNGPDSPAQLWSDLRL